MIGLTIEKNRGEKNAYMVYVVYRSMDDFFNYGHVYRRLFYVSQISKAIPKRRR